ncbi:MAG: DUF6229 family protein [Jatrophihabitantaceae bacterium]
MNTAVLEQLDSWLTSDRDNPAGPLFTGSYAEADLTDHNPLATACSSCTASRTGECC